MSTLFIVILLSIPNCFIFLASRDCDRGRELESQIGVVDRGPNLSIIKISHRKMNAQLFFFA